MKLLNLTCNHCGAPLEVPAKTKFLTCSYCSSRLAVQHSGNAFYTEVLEALEERTEQIAEDVEIIKVQNKLDQLDREWMAQRENHMVRGKHGEYRVPSKAGSMIGAAIAVVFGIIWMGIAASAGGGAFALFGLVVIGVAIAGAIYQAHKAEAYQQNKRIYQSRRQDVLSDLRNLERKYSN